MERSKSRDSMLQGGVDGRGVASEVAWPPLGHRGRLTPVAHGLFYGTLLIAMAMSGARAPAPSSRLTELVLAAFLAAWYGWWIARLGDPTDLVGGEGIRLVSRTSNPVPEPSTALLLGAGLAAIGVRSRRRSRGDG